LTPQKVLSLRADARTCRRLAQEAVGLEEIKRLLEMARDLDGTAERLEHQSSR